MIKLEIGNQPHQELLVPFEDDFIKIELKYLNGLWFIDVSYKEKYAFGLKLSSKVFMLTGKNYPFEIFIDDKGIGLDVFQLDDFSNDRFDFLILEREEITGLRGYEVE